MNRQGPGRPPHQDVLTPAEWKVTEQVRHGMTNRRIAERMSVSPDAVKFHVANALSKLGFSSREQLRLWNGIAKDAALYQLRRQGMITQDTDVRAFIMLGQVARTVSSVEASRAWYRDSLGLPELYAFPGLAFYDLGGVRLMLTDEGNGAQDSILYLRVPDIHAAKEALEERGIEFTHAPHLIHRHEDGAEEWMSFFKDNEGRPLALLSQVRVNAR
jgi:DNA-binding CsgD family transcriptional regulator/catechol 2,3-dioxygenase-like lactoylglutathione lyase family enzyme